jgi:threonine synthase
VLATNANRTLPEYLETSAWLPRESVATLASAMDVGNPSNMERLHCLLGDAAALREQLSVVSIDDGQIEDEIRRAYAEFGFAICPHTATAAGAWRNMVAAEQGATHWILVATAHPAKFETIVEPLIGAQVPVPPELAAILSRPQRETRIEPTLEAFAAALRHAFG